MPLSPSATRALLDQLGHHPRKHLGQNFLIDGNIVRKSIALAEVSAGDRVVEIGPGLGTLTEELLATGASVWAVEKDPTLFAHLSAALLPRFPHALHLTEGDAVELPLAGLAPGADAAGFKIVANLPYAISTPWMDAVLGGPLPARMVLMLQEESARRFSAEPGTKSFGPITLFLQSAYATAPGHRVSGECFFPRPDVGSYLLNLVRRPAPFVFPTPVKLLIRECFQQRRKQIGAIVRERLPDRGAAWLAQLARAGIGPQARPEDIPIPAWQGLAGV